MPPKQSSLDRREMIRMASATIAFFAAHGLALGRPSGSEARIPEPTVSPPRLLKLELLSSAPLAEMKSFYHDTLGFPLVEDKKERLAVRAGSTSLSFLPSPAEHGRPFYHFAFNIPENKIRSAHAWQKQRTPLLPIPASLRDPAYPEEVVNYSHWNAHSVFFFDPAGNVVEYIARHDLKNAAAGEFGPGDILYASEIAFVVDDVAATAERLRAAAGTGQYRGASDQFAAIGDENGLLLVMKRGRIISFESPTKKAVSVFRTAASVRGAKAETHKWNEYPYELTVEA
jgi:catechol 2,3-dioxygenase-like lactoylglutathione lyase family enzyme